MISIWCSRSFGWMILALNQSRAFWCLVSIYIWHGYVSRYHQYCIYLHEHWTSSILLDKQKNIRTHIRFLSACAAHHFMCLAFHFIVLLWWLVVSMLYLLLMFEPPLWLNISHTDVYFLFFYRFSPRWLFFFNFMRFCGWLNNFLFDLLWIQAPIQKRKVRNETGRARRKITK